MSVLLFAGPTLPPGEAGNLDGIEMLPPVAQGDLYRAVRQFRPRAVGIVDGYFHQQPSVWHKEMLWTLAQGIPVYGAASMGALRAAELDAFGMIGVGRIYQAYRDGHYPPYHEPFENDDEVAVLHGPPETGYLRLSEALVDLRQGLAEAAEAGIIDQATRDRLAAAAATLPYGERTIDALCALIDGEPAGALRSWWDEAAVSQKRRDALALVGRLQAIVSGEERPVPASPVFHGSSVWDLFVAAEETRLADALSDDEALVVDDLRLDPPRWAALAREAGRMPHPSGDTGMRAAFEAWRTAHGLGSRPALAGWMAENGLDDTALTALFRRAADRGGAGATPAGARDVVDHLILTGRFPAALREARRRRERLDALSPARRPADMRALAERYGLSGPDFAREPLQATAARLGYPDIDAFEDALWRRHLLDSAGETP
jgi:hypothetical protein